MEWRRPEIEAASSYCRVLDIAKYEAAPILFQPSSPGPAASSRTHVDAGGLTRTLASRSLHRLALVTAERSFTRRSLTELLGIMAITTAELLAFLRTQRLAVQATRGREDSVQAAIVGIAVTDTLE